MAKYDNKINKKKENNEPFDLEKYIDDIEQYRKQRKILDLLGFLKFLEKERMIRLQKKPEIRVRVFELDTSLDKEILERIEITAKPRKENKMKIEWIE
ncbi:hypothetical protein ES705_25333 [subsurface metagenome]